MKTWLTTYFAITEKGAANVLRAAALSLIKYMSSSFAPLLAMLFLYGLMNNSLLPLWVYLAGLCVVLLVVFAACSAEYRLCYDATYQESADLRISLANRLKQLPLSYFSTHSLTDLSQAIMMDVSNVEITISHALPQGLGFLGFLTLITISMIAYCPLLGLCVVAPLWACIGLLLWSKRFEQQAISRYYERLLDNAASFQEAFDLQQEIKSYSLQNEVRTTVQAKLNDTEKIHVTAEFTMAIIGNLLSFLPYASIALTAVCGLALVQAGSLDLLPYLGYLVTITTISAQWVSIAEFLLTVVFFDDTFARLRELKNMPIPTGTQHLTKPYDITLSNVDFSYGDHPVLRGLSLTAAQGRVTALVGPSGCGKTTVLRLIARLYDHTSGSITIGTTPVDEANTEELLQNISMVFQNVELFNTSVLENIRLGRSDATDAEVLEAARLAEVDEIAERLPDGYNTLIGENGSRLSGGERQRISIARALLKNAPIVLLDEVSASLDVENENRIQASLSRLLAGKTVVVVSHRLRSIEQADSIVVMRDGQVECAGTHDELMDTSATYRSMIEKSLLTEEWRY